MKSYKTKENYQYHIFAPYRVCPLGAHVDHQHGLVTGFAIDKGVDLWFNVNDSQESKVEGQRSLAGESCASRVENLCGTVGQILFHENEKLESSIINIR